MKKHIYFREDLQELRELPINEENCYYLGELSNAEIKRIEKYLSVTMTPFKDLSRNVENGMFRSNGR
jgi:hypothetical protein